MAGYSFIVKATPRRLIDPEDAAEYVGGEAILSKLEKAGWIKPTVRQHKITRFDTRLLDLAVDRINRDGLPN